MKRLLLLGLIAMGTAHGQCTLWNQSACSSVCTASACTSATESLGTFLANTEASFQAMRAVTAHAPQPQIKYSANLVPASDLPGDVWVFGPAIVPYMTALKNLGITIDFVQPYGPAYVCDPGYQSTYVTPYVGTLAGGIAPSCDCAGGSPFAYGASPATGAGPKCASLYYLDQMVTNANSTHLNLTLWADWAGTANDVQFFLGSGANIATVSLAQYEAMYLPVLEAVVNRYPSGTFADHTVYTEPTAAMMSWTAMNTPSNLAAWVKAAATVIKNVTPAATVGAAVTGWSNWGDVPYMEAWETLGNACGSSGTLSCFDVLDLDTFQGTCGSAGNAYANYMAGIISHFVTPTLAGTYGAPRIVRIGQAQHPLWNNTGSSANDCLASAPVPTEPYAILGLLDSVWDSTGMQNAWMDVHSAWVKANGIQNENIYCDLPFFWYTSSVAQASDYCNSGTTAATAMAGLGLTDSGRSYGGLAAGWMESLQGTAYLSGHAHIGR